MDGSAFHIVARYMLQAQIGTKKEKFSLKSADSTIITRIKLPDDFGNQLEDNEGDIAVDYTQMRERYNIKEQNPFV